MKEIEQEIEAAKKSQSAPEKAAEATHVAEVKEATRDIEVERSFTGFRRLAWRFRRRSMGCRTSS
jgi:hypothetical protein